MKKFILKKIRRIFGIDTILQVQYQIFDELKGQTTKINEIYYAHLFHSATYSSPWLKNKSFSPGRWAVDFSFLYTLYRVLNGQQPKEIVEFGLGETTRMLSQYCDAFNARVSTFEHDSKWALFFQRSFALSQKLQLIEADLEEITFKGFKTLSYNKRFLKSIDQKLQLIIIDGPFGSLNYSRIQILDLIPHCIDFRDFCILIDDYQRAGEKETATEVCNVLKTNNIDFVSKEYAGEKRHLLICSPNNQFLLSI